MPDMIVRRALERMETGMSTQKATKPSKISAKPEPPASKKGNVELAKEDLDKVTGGTNNLNLSKSNVN